MCAINGLINWDRISELDSKKIQKSLGEMKYRGPDFSNQEKYDYAILGHNRLSILDLNSRSNQPLKSKNQRYTIVFNGEIYNYKEIKVELENMGVIFESTSDTEVLLEGFQIYGEEILPKLRGMFAFAIWDNQKNELFIARDRFGEKPFYYFYDQNKIFAFASNLAGITPLVHFDLEINELLSTQFIDSESCIYNKIEKMNPGYFARINQKEIQIEQYWSPDYKNKIEENFANIKQNVNQLLESSIAEQLESDVQVGLFLSGGVDSSIVASIASKYKKDLTAITMSVPENKSFDEAEAAKFVAQKLKINHTIINLDQNCVSNLPYILKTIEPIADASLIPTMVIAKEASKNFKVMLSGDGGDEIFGGYKNPIHFIENPFKGNFITKSIINSVLKSSDKFPYHYLYSKINDKRLFKWGSLESYYQNKSLSKSETDIIKNDLNEFQNKFLTHYNESKLHCNNEVDKLLYVGIKSNLTNDFLLKMDSANMFYSVESRSPFLDHRILDYTSKLSINQLMPNGIDKEILKNIGSDYLPKEFFNNIKKGFSIPYYDYLKTTWGNLLADFIKEGISSEMNLINADVVLKLINDYKKKQTFRLGKILYSILVFEIWLRVFHLKMNPEQIKLI